MGSKDKLTLLFIKYSPVIMLYTCIAKIVMQALELPIITKEINVLLNLFIVCGLYLASFTFNFCKVHRGLLNLTIFGYLNYEVYLLFHIPFNNLFTRVCIVLYILVCLIYSLKHIKKCKL